MVVCPWSDTAATLLSYAQVSFGIHCCLSGSLLPPAQPVLLPSRCSHVNMHVLGLTCKACGAVNRRGEESHSAIAASPCSIGRDL